MFMVNKRFIYYDTIGYDTIGEFNVDSKAEYITLLIYEASRSVSLVSICRLKCCATNYFLV